MFLDSFLWGAPPVPFGCSMWNTSSSVPADGHGPDSWRCDHVTRIVSFLQGNKVLIFVILVLWVHLAAGYFEACWNGVPICYCLCHNADHKLVNKLLLTNEKSEPNLKQDDMILCHHDHSSTCDKRSFPNGGRNRHSPGSFEDLGSGIPISSIMCPVKTFMATTYLLGMYYSFSQEPLHNLVHSEHCNTVGSAILWAILNCI